jgi:small subunit ribosomal protein S9
MTTKKQVETDVKTEVKKVPTKVQKKQNVETTKENPPVAKKVQIKNIESSTVELPAKAPKVKNLKNNKVTKARRKTSVCVIRQTTKGGIVLNGKAIKDYFTPKYFTDVALQAIKTLKVAGHVIDIESVNLFASLHGGGIKGHAESFSTAFAKHISANNDEFKKILKQAGLIATDSRIVERKLPGFRKSRKKEQFSKR